jgi:hypothetical protein
MNKIEKIKYNIFSGGLAALAALLGKLGSETIQNNILNEYYNL